jgi:hypothetical protein
MQGLVFEGEGLQPDPMTDVARLIVHQSLACHRSEENTARGPLNFPHQGRRSMNRIDRHHMNLQGRLLLILTGSCLSPRLIHGKFGSTVELRFHLALVCMLADLIDRVLSVVHAAH